MTKSHDRNPWPKPMTETHDQNPWPKPTIKPHDWNPWPNPMTKTNDQNPWPKLHDRDPWPRPMTEMCGEKWRKRTWIVPAKCGANPPRRAGIPSTVSHQVSLMVCRRSAFSLNWVTSSNSASCCVKIIEPYLENRNFRTLSNKNPTFLHHFPYTTENCGQ